MAAFDIGTRQPIRMPHQERARPAVTAQCQELGEAPARKDGRHSHASRIETRSNHAILSFPRGHQPLQVVTGDAHLVGQHDEHGIARRRQRRDSGADRRRETFLPVAINDDRSRRMLEQHRDVLSVGAEHNRDSVPGDGDRVAHHGVEQGPAVNSHQLFRLAKPRRSARCQHQDVEARGCLFHGPA
jgi:hypothetical protein